MYSGGQTLGRASCGRLTIKQNAGNVNVVLSDDYPLDGIYAILSDQDRRERIRGLGSEQGNGSELGDVIGQLEMLLARLKAKA